jgi:hypothetical protein
MASGSLGRQSDSFANPFEANLNLILSHRESQ